MRKLAWILGFGFALSASACGKKAAPPAGAGTAAATAATGTAAPETAAPTAKPAPKIDPNDPHETFQLVLEKGKTALKGAQRERFEVLSQAEELKFDEPHKAQADAFAALRKKVEEFSIGEDAATLATSAKRVCALIEEVRTGALKLTDDGNAELKVLGDQQKELEAKQKDGGKVSQATWDKLDQAKQAVSVPVLAARHLWLALKTILVESLTVVDLGSHQVQLDFKECLTTVAKNPIPFDIAQTQLEKVIEKATYYTNLE